LSAPISVEIVLSYVGAAAKSIILGLIILATAIVRPLRIGIRSG
jgi:hypothetical protein